MKVCVLGGAGEMGARASLDIGQARDVARLTIAGRSLDKADALAQSIGPVARGVAVDVNDAEALVSLMQEHDVVAGAVGPYYRYEVLLAQAAIDAGVPYVSICDDYDASQGVLTLNDRAKDKGVTIVSGAGWTPGITNIMVRRAADRLDSARAAHIAWVASATDGTGEAVLYHMMHILTGDVPTYTGGQWQHVPAGSGQAKVDFGPPIGSVPVYHVGHPEPVTIPRFMPELEEVTLRGGLIERYLDRFGLLLARSGLTKDETRRDYLVKMLSSSTSMLRKMKLTAAPIAGAHVAVHGQKDGRPAHIVSTVNGSMADLTALPLAITTLMIGRGQLHRPGVVSLEAKGLIDVDDFISQLADRGVTIFQGGVSFDGDPTR